MSYREQRELAAIERILSREDPVLADRLSRLSWPRSHRPWLIALAITTAILGVLCVLLGLMVGSAGLISGGVVVLVVSVGLVHRVRRGRF
jgi:protein-S-isoprenylcysteine O-methyltransferase Ste14